MPLLRHLLHHLPSPLHPRLLSTATSATPSSSPALISSLLSSLSQFSSPDSTQSSFRTHFLLHYSDVTFTTPLLSSLLSPSPSTPSLSRSPLLLFSHLVSDRSFTPSDLSISLLLRHLSLRHDYSPIPSLLSSLPSPSPAGPTSFTTLSTSFVRSKRPNDAASLFLSLPSPLFPSLSKSKSLLLPILTSFADHGFPTHAERLVKSCVRDVFPDESVRGELLRCYCRSFKIADARRLAGEFVRGGFHLTTADFNHMLDCVCRIARKRDPVRMKPEADKFLAEMDVPRDSETFRVLVYNLCKIRKTGDAMKVFRRMGEWNCSPCAETYLVLVRSLYQAARVMEGDEMMGWMRAAGFGDRLDRKAYYGFVKILCGIERVDHAMKVFRMMKAYGHTPGVKSYDLLVGKLAEHNQVDRAKALFKEARARGVEVAEREYKVDPRFAKKKEKKVKKRETLPEKMKRKRRTLKRLRLSFVKKPKKQRRLA